jgi:hypothetical protein
MATATWSEPRHGSRASVQAASRCPCRCRCPMPGLGQRAPRLARIRAPARPRLTPPPPTPSPLVARYTTGAVYDGQFDRGVRHGEGTLKFANGDTYAGRWDGDVKEGKGVMTWVTLGASYDGDFARGVMHGFGTYTFPDGSIYKGAYVEGQRSGKGSLRLADGSKETADDWDGPQRGTRFRPELALKRDPAKDLMQREAALETYIETLEVATAADADEAAADEWDPM